MHNACMPIMDVGSYFTQLEAVAGFNDDRYGQKLVHNKSRKAEEKHWTCSPPHKYFFLSSIEKWKDESNESNENEECMLLYMGKCWTSDSDRAWSSKLDKWFVLAEAEHVLKHN